jgi:hypothetical protein
MAGDKDGDSKYCTVILITRGEHHENQIASCFAFYQGLDRSLFLFKDLLGFKEIWSVDPVGGKGMAAVFGLEDMKALPPSRRLITGVRVP